MAPTRRQIIASAGTLITGGIATSIATQPTTGQTSVSVNGLSVPDASTQASSLSDIGLAIDGDYQYSTNQEPSRIVIRLSASRNNGYRQIDALEPTPNSPSDSGGYELSGSLLNLQSLQSGELVPSNPGETNSYTIDIRVAMEITHPNGQTAQATAEETVTIDVTKSEVTISASIGGSGQIQFETPTN